MKGFQEVFAADGRCVLAFDADGVLVTEQGVTAAGEALVADPEIRIFTGAVSEETMEMVDLSKTTESAIRGIIIMGDPNDTIAGHFEVSSALLFDRVEAPYYHSDVLTAYNNFGFAIDESMLS